MGASNRAKNQPDTKGGPAPASMAQETNIAGRHAHDRLLYLMATFVGSQTNITLKSQDRFTGIFSAASLEPSANCVVLKMSRKLTPQTNGQVNGSAEPPLDYIGYGDDKVTTFDLKDVVDLHVPSRSTDTKIQHRLANGSSIRTDTDISGNLEVKERQLEAWQDTSVPSINLSMNGGAPGQWDQFETNKTLFGVDTDYDETMYTTAINRSDPSYKERAARADRLAREIERSETNNAHVAEERNMQSSDTNGMDEEARYSGVARDHLQLAASNPNRYTPPARRAPTAHATVAGAPFDPAIISSSLATHKPVTASSNAQSTVSQGSPDCENVKPNAVQDVSNTAEAELSKGAPAAQDSGIKAVLDSSSANKHSTPLASRLPALPASGQAPPSKILDQDVNSAFKMWGATEKARVRHTQQAANDQKKLKDRDSKINDLKRFSANFKLKSQVPQDILGILARDKEKQKELQQKSKHEIEAQASKPSPQAPVIPDRSPVTLQAERQSNKSSRVPSQGQTPNMTKVDRSPHSNNNMQQRVTGNLGQRVASYGVRGGPLGQNYGPQDPRAQQAQMAAMDATAAARRAGDGAPGNAASRMKGSALSFKPNPMATPFQVPSDGRSSTSSPNRSRARSEVKTKPVNAVKFFKGKRPEAGSKRPLSEGFNPVARMKREVEASEKPKEYASNGGIPQAFRTPPTWPVSKENENRSYIEVADKVLLPNSPAPMVPTQYAHHQQLPAHFNQGYYNGNRTPSHGQQRHNQNREYFDHHRMHPNSSQSSVPPSPSMRQINVMPQQVAFRNDNSHMAYGQPPTPNRQIPPGAYLYPAHGAPPMMATQSYQGQYFGGGPTPGQPPNSYGPGGMYVAQGPPPVAFNSPRQNPMMMQQGQPPMQMAQQHPYPVQVAPGYPPPSPQIQMRGGMPMMQQNSYNGHGSFPMQQYRGGPNGGGFPQQQFMQAGPGQMPGFPVRHPSDQSER